METTSFPVLWSGLCCDTVKCSEILAEILAHIELLYNRRVNKVFTSLHFTSVTVLYFQLIAGTVDEFERDSSNHLKG